MKNNGTYKQENGDIDPYREHPNKAAFKDFKKLNENRLEKMMKATNDGKGETIKMTFEMPVEYVSLASWLAMRKVQYQGGNNIPMDLSDVVSEPLNNHDIKIAGDYISSMLDDQLLLKEYHDLCTGYHLYLYNRPEQNSTDLPEEDLPF